MERGSGALLGAGSLFTGTLVFSGDVRVDGSFAGRISTDAELVVGEEAVVTADVDCGRAIVQGVVVGSIRASESVELRASARVRGDVVAPALAIESGASFDGGARIGEAPALTSAASDA